MPIENPSTEDLEAGLKIATTYKLDGKKYMTTRTLAEILGMTYYEFSRFKKDQRVMDPALKLGGGNYYTIEQARAIYTALYLSKA